MFRRHVDFVAVLLIAIALLAFSNASSLLRVPDPDAIALLFN
jgi:hypothetical protein